LIGQPSVRVEIKFPVIVAAVVLSVMVVGALLGYLPTLVVAGSVAASAISVILMVIDKRRAVKNQRRVSEKTLHLAELFGGWPGSLAAQHVVRHKNRKVSYQVVFVLCATVHATLLIWWAFFR